MHPTTTPPLRIGWFIWGLGALFYLMGFFQRVAPAVLTDVLMRDFGIGAAALGNLSAVYFYSYAAMQIPTGIIADVWGARRLLTVGAIVAGCGTVLFALAPGIIWANLGRLLIGGSVAVAFVGLLKLSSSWLPSRFYAMASGLALFCGIIGAVFAGTPLRLAVGLLHWRTVILISAAITFLISVTIWSFVRDFPDEKGYVNLTDSKKGLSTVSLKTILAGIIEVFKYPNTLFLCVIPGGVVGGVLTFSGLWGVPFLTTHYGLRTSQSAVLTSALLVSWAIGGPFFGWLSDRLGQRKPLYIIGCTVTLCGWAAVIFASQLPISGLTALLLLTGFSSGCMIISFAYVKESVPPRLSGTVSGVVNTGVMLGPTLLQPAVGWVLDQKWQGQTLEGVRIYDLAAYQSGFALLIVWVLLSLILLFFTRETNCRQIA